MTRVVLFGLSLPGASLLLAGFMAAQPSPSASGLLLAGLVILLLVLLNALFVSAEFAIASVSDTDLERLADEGNRTAGKVLQIVENRPRLDHYIATAQLGVTLASLALAMYGVPRVSQFIEPALQAAVGLNATAARLLSYTFAIALLAYLHVVVGEIVPKVLALSNPVAAALSLDRIMGVLLDGVLSAPARALNRIGAPLLRAFNIPSAQGHGRLMAADELVMIVAESVEGGLIEDDEQIMIRNIFDFNERTVGQVMTPRRKVQALPVDCEEHELIHTVTQSRHSRFPVYEKDQDHIVGILHLKDLIRLTLGPDGPFDLRLILRTAPEVPEDFRVDRLLAAFKREKLHMAIVRDEFGGFAGVVTLEDLVEEIVGEVRDEFDIEREPYALLSPGVLELSGDYLLDLLANDVYLGQEDELPDVETVGGLIVSLLGRPPLNGDMVNDRNGIRFMVLDVDGRAVTRARVEFPAFGGNSESDDIDEEE